MKRFLEDFFDLRFAVFEFKTRLLNDCYLSPYKGSTLRGSFGHNLKRLFCSMSGGRRKCSECLLKSKCPYFYIFETPSCENFNLMKKYPAVPHPFVIEPPEDLRREYKKDEPFNFNLILIGKGIDYLPYFIHVFQEMGRIGLGMRRQGRYTLSEVINHGFSSKNGTTVYKSKENTLTTPENIISGKDIIQVAESLGEIKKIKLSFITPVRIKYREKLISYLEFHIFMRTFLRRLSTLSYFHCNKELVLDFKELINRAKLVDMIYSDLQWQDFERYSTKNRKKMKLGGFTGTITFQGNLEEFAAFILLGKYLHIGKSTAFGLGKYNITL